jgi:hypothetical protein
MFPIVESEDPAPPAGLDVDPDLEIGEILGHAPLSFQSGLARETARAQVLGDLIAPARAACSLERGLGADSGSTRGPLRDRWRPTRPPLPLRVDDLLLPMDVGTGGIVLTRPRQFSVSVPLGRTGQEHVTRDPMRRWADDAAMSAWQTTRPCVGQPRPTEALCSYRCHEPGGRFHDLAHVSALVNIWQVDSGTGDEPTNAATYSIFQHKIAGSGAGSAGRYGSGCLAVGDSTRASHVIELGTVVRYCVRQTQPV